MKTTTQLSATAAPAATAPGRASPTRSALRTGAAVRDADLAPSGSRGDATGAGAREDLFRAGRTGVDGDDARDDLFRAGRTGVDGDDARDELFRGGYARHRDAVWRYLARRLDDDDLAEDLTSEVFLTAWRRRHDAPCAELPWLYGVARRVLANDRRAARSRARRLQAVAGELAVAPTAEPGPADRGAGAYACARALAALSDRDRELLLLAAWEELSPAELATALGCRPNTARVRLHRARRRFTALLDQHTKGTTT